MIGSTISHYKILEKLGEGGMGVVYKAEDTKLLRIVALKFLPPGLTRDEDSKERFIHEARAASALDHPNICTIHEIGETNDGALYIGMAYYEGVTLKERISDGPLPLNEVLNIAIQMCRGLGKAHEKGILHRDIKPANVLVTSDDVVKIVDFGLAKLTGRTNVTKTGLTMGTAAYMSPEQALGEGVDHRSDIWSFGVVLYEMLTGEPPFKSEFEQALVYSILNEKPRPISAIRPEIPPALDTIVQKCLEKEAANRYGSMGDLLSDFFRIKGLPFGPSSKGGLAKNRFRPIKTPALFALVGLLLIAGYFYLPGLLKPTVEGPPIPKLPVAVMIFENLVDPEDKDRTGGIISNLLITSLSQLKALEVASRERLQNIHLELGQTDAKSLPPGFTAQVAQRAGVKAFVTGSVLQIQPVLAVTVQVVDVGSGAVVGSQRVAGYSREQIFALVDTLAMLLTNDLKVAPLSPGERKPVAEITTKSPAAYRAYLEGMEYWSNLYVPEARSAFEQAIELDSSFIEAYYRRSGLRVSGGRPYLEKAVQLSERATEPLRMLIRADQYSILEENPKKGVETLEKLIRLYPRDEYAYVSLFFTYRSLLEHEKALEAVRRGSKVNPSSLLLLIGISYQAAYLNHEKEALEASSEYLKLSPRAPDPYATRGDIFSLLGKYDSSRVWYERGYALRRQYVHVNLINDAVAREDYKTAMNYIEADEWNGSWHIFLIGLHRGQQRSARERLMKALEEQKSKNLSPDRNNTYRELIHLTYEQGDHKEMLRLSREANIGKDYLAWALFKAGEKGEAQKLLEELKDEVNSNLPLTQVVHDYRSALLAYEEKLFSKAVVHFRRAYRRLPPNRSPNLFFAVSLSKNGEVDAAAQELLRLTQWYPLGLHTEFIPDAPGQHRYWPISQVKAWYWLGLVYEQQGEKVKAITSFKKFLDLWKAADFKSEEIEDAKIRVAKLKTLVMK